MSEQQKWGRVAEVIESKTSSFAGKTFLTVDMDWAHDVVMRDTLALIANAGVPSTWFVTHESPFLRELEADSSVELGIHPNFNRLLLGDTANGRTVQEVITRLLDIVPSAKSVRAHSLFQSSRILETYCALGLTHDATHFMEPATSGFHRPWTHYGLVRVPLSWEDYISLHRSQGVPSMCSVMPDTNHPLCRQVDFHPIHVFLNTQTLSQYEDTRAIHRNPDQLEKKRHKGPGIRRLLSELLETA